MGALRGRSCPIRLLPAAAACCIGLLAAGCGGKVKPPKTVPVVGQVLLDGKPLAAAQVTFVPAGEVDPGAARPSGITDEEGRFSLTTFSDKDGAPEGAYVALVVWRPLVGSGEDLVPGPNALPVRYSEPGQSPFQVRVQEGRSELEPFQLSRR